MPIRIEGTDVGGNVLGYYTFHGSDRPLEEETVDAYDTFHALKQEYLANVQAAQDRYRRELRALDDAYFAALVSGGAEERQNRQPAPTVETPLPTGNRVEIGFLGDGDGNILRLFAESRITPETPLPAGYHYRYEPRAGDQTIVVRHIVKGNKALCGKVRQGQLAMVYGGDTILCRGCGWQMEIDTS